MRWVGKTVRHTLGIVRLNGRKGAAALVERGVLTRFGDVEEGKAGLELGEEESRAELVEAAP